MKGQETPFSHKGDEWETPKWLFDKLNSDFVFDIDAAATQENALAPGYFTKEDDALKQDWFIDYGEDGIVKTVFLNPPYSKIAAFMKKAYEESLKGALVVCLIPCRTDTRYWHDYVMKASEIRLIKGRLKFINKTLPSYREDGNFKTSSATFPSCVVVFDNRKINHGSPLLLSIVKDLGDI